MAVARDRGVGAETAWLEEPERGRVWLMRIMLWIAMRLGRLPAELLLYPITLVFFLSERKARARSRAYLARVLPHPPTARDVFRNFHAFACVILDRVFLMVRACVPAGSLIDDPDGLQARLARGEGVVLVSAHLGSFDSLRTLAVEHGMHRVKILMREAQNAKLTRLLGALNPTVGAMLVPWRGPADMLRLKRWASQGHVIGVMGDRLRPQDPRHETTFLGGLAAFPLGPAQLAASLRVPLFFACSVREPDGSYHARFALLADPDELPHPRDLSKLATVVERYAQELERAVRLSPYSWFNFYDFWAA